LWSWRAEYGDAAWQARLGRTVVASGPEHLYELISEGTASGVPV
jgi:hypothetical protein